MTGSHVTSSCFHLCSYVTIRAHATMLYSSYIIKKSHSAGVESPSINVK